MGHLPWQHVARHLDERHLGWIAEPFRPSALARLLDLLAVQGGQQQLPREVARLGQRFLRRRKEAAIDIEPAHRHAVLGQGAGLVGADHGGRAQRLHRGEVLDQNAFPRQALAGHGQRQGDGRQQSLGDVGDDDADREHGAVPERQANGVADRKKCDAEPGRQRRDEARKKCHLALQRRQGRSGGLGKVRDFPKRGAHAGREDHGAPIPRDHVGAGEQDVAARGQLMLFAGRGIPGDGQRLAGDRRVVDL
jgi:hypothetical protein